MRNEFIEFIHNDFKKKDDFYFITADLGFSVLEKLQKKYKNKFINSGICEANMTLLSIGMSEYSNVVYNYSIAPFLSLRCFELYRNYLNRDKRNIKIIAVGSGFSYGEMGPTHHIVEDISIMSTLEYFYICNPSSLEELIYIFNLQKKKKAPFYIRLNKTTPKIPTSYRFKKFKDFFYKKGTGLNIISSGGVLDLIINSLSAHDIKKVNHISLPELNQFDIKSIIKLINIDNLLIVFDFYLSSKKLMSLIDQIKVKIANNKIIILDLDSNKDLKVGNTSYLLEQSGISISNIKKNIKNLV